MNGAWNDCSAAESGTLARGMCAYTGVEVCPRSPPWVGAPLFGGVHVALPVVQSFRALFIKGGGYIKDQMYFKIASYDVACQALSNETNFNKIGPLRWTNIYDDVRTGPGVKERIHLEGDFSPRPQTLSSAP